MFFFRNWLNKPRKLNKFVLLFLVWYYAKIALFMSVSFFTQFRISYRVCPYMHIAHSFLISCFFFFFFFVPFTVPFLLSLFFLNLSIGRKNQNQTTETFWLHFQVKYTFCNSKQMLKNTYWSLFSALAAFHVSRFIPQVSLRKMLLNPLCQNY